MLLCLLISACSSEPVSVPSEVPVFLNHPDSAKQWLAVQKKKATAFRERGANDSALYLLDSAFKVLQPQAEELELYKDLGWLHAGRAYILGELQGRFLEARKAYMSADACFSAIGFADFQVGRYVYEPLGNIYLRLGDYQQAERYLKLFFDLAEQAAEPAAIADACNDLAMVGIAANDAQASRAWLSRGLALDSLSPLNRLLLLSNMARSYSLDQNWLEAIEWGEKGLDAVPDKNALPQWQSVAISDYTIGTLTVLIESNGALGNIKEVERLAERSLAVMNEPGSSVRLRKQTKVLLRLGQAYSKLKLPSQSLTFFDRALRKLIEDYDTLNATALPSKSQLYPERLIGIAMEGKLELLLQEETQNQSLHKVFTHFDRLFDFEAELRSELLSDASRLEHSARYAALGQRAVEFAFTHYNESAEDSLLWKALAYAEASKAMLLSEALNREVFQELASTQQHLASLIDIRQEIASQRMRSNEHRTISKLGQEEARLKDDLAKDHPELYQQWYKSNLLPAKELQRWSKVHQQAIVSAFFAEEQLFIFCQANGELSATSIPVSEGFIDSLAAFEQAQGDPGLVAPSDFQKMGFGLYQRLMWPFENELQEFPQWIFLPDGAVSALNLDLLCTSDKPENSFRDLPYLIRTREISYAPSMAFLMNQRTQYAFSYGLLNIQPSFDCSSHFDALPSVRFPLAVECLESFQLQNQNATVRALLTEGKRAQVLHFSAHGSASKTSSRPSWIVLSDSMPCEHQKLYFPELQAASIHPELAVVQACQSASGGYQKGEGVLSVSHSLVHAGCANVIAAAWDANPESSGAILEHFYQLLWEQGQPVQSLRAAKLNYLESEDLDEYSSHPYFWSGLVLTGTGEFHLKPAGRTLETMVVWNLCVVAISVISLLIYFKLSVRKSN